MSKPPEHPTLFQFARAQDRHGFYPLKLLHVHPHYVRVVVDESNGRVVVDVLPYELLDRARAYKPHRNAHWYVSTAWREDEEYRQRIRSLIFSHGGSLDEAHTLHFGADDTVAKGR